MRALVVGALGDSAVWLLLGLSGLAAVVADGGEVVDLVGRLDPGLVRTAVHPGRRVGALDLPAVLDPARDERPAQHSAVECPGPLGVLDIVREVGEIVVSGCGRRGR